MRIKFSIAMDSLAVIESLPPAGAATLPRDRHPVHVYIARVRDRARSADHISLDGGRRGGIDRRLSVYLASPKRPLLFLAPTDVATSIPHFVSFEVGAIDTL
jgi:hypothetical protein